MPFFLLPIKSIRGCIGREKKLKVIPEICIVDERRSKAPPPEVHLPDHLWHRIINLSNPYDVINWRRVCRRLKTLIDHRFATIIYLDVWKTDINAIVESEPTQWQRHPKCQLLLQLSNHRAILAVHDKWTSRDVDRLSQALHMFRRSAHTVLLDSAIAEMIVADLSSIELNRWYSFLCYLQTFGNSSDMHMKCIPPPPTDRIVADDMHASIDPYFPNLCELTIRSTQLNDFDHLSRIADYGIAPNAVWLPSTLQLLRLHITDTRALASSGGSSNSLQHSPKSTRKFSSRYVHAFRSWADTDALGERYCQQYTTNV